MNEDKLKRIYDKCNEKSYIVIKEIINTNDKEKLHLKDSEGYCGVIPIGKFLRGVQEDISLFSNRNPYVLENIRLYLKYNAPNLTLKSEEYKRIDIPLEFICCNHGLYISTFVNIKSGYNCPKCAKEKISKMRRTPLEKVYNTFLNKGFTPLFTEYKNESELLDAINEEGFKISVSYASIKNSEPQIFGHKNKYTIDNIKLWLKINGFEHIELLSEEYIDAHTDLKFYCKKHEEVVYATWNNVSKGKLCYKCGLEKRSGENHPFWNSELTDEERELKRNYPEYNEWREKVYKRDNYACVCCGTKGIINAHHLNGYNWDREHRIDVNNGITLCEVCHKEFHDIYGKGNNTIEQFKEFIDKKELGIVLP